MPVDPKTGKEYPYTEEGIEQHRKDTGGMPFKMKGSKFYGKGNQSPAKHGTTDDFLYGRNGHNPDTMSAMHEDWHGDKIKLTPEERKEKGKWVKGGEGGEDKDKVTEEKERKEKGREKDRVTEEKEK